MKKSFALIAMLMAFALCAAPAMASNPNEASVNVKATVQEYIALSPSTQNVSLTLNDLNPKSESFNLNVINNSLLGVNIATDATAQIGSYIQFGAKDLGFEIVGVTPTDAHYVVGSNSGPTTSAGDNFPVTVQSAMNYTSGPDHKLAPPDTYEVNLIFTATANH